MRRLFNIYKSEIKIPKFEELGQFFRVTLYPRSMYIALFSRFIPCGVYEAVYILDGLIENESDIKPDTIHGDTQSQNAPVFGLAYLLGIDLMHELDLKYQLRAIGLHVDKRSFFPQKKS